MLLISFVEYCFKILISFGLGFLKIEGNVWSFINRHCCKGFSGFCQRFLPCGEWRKTLRRTLVGFFEWVVGRLFVVVCWEFVCFVSVREVLNILGLWVCEFCKCCLCELCGCWLIVIHIINSGYFGCRYPWILALSWSNHVKYYCQLWMFYFLIHVNVLSLASNHKNQY